MIICNRCNKQVPAGLPRCQNCGAPLSSAANTGVNAQEPSELPTWLESLRVNERPGAPADGQPGFSTADLIDDDDLPGWMRAEQTPDHREGDSNRYPAVRPASMPAPNTDAGMMRSAGFSAHDLIDPVALPSWMNPNQQPANPAAPKEVSAPGKNPQSAPPPTFGLNPYQESPVSPFSASDLIDRQSLPPWMSSGRTDQPPPPLVSATWPGGSAPAAPVPPQNIESGPQSGLSASSLLDVNSLPPWLREGQQAQGQPGSNMSAGSLIDMNALPSWLRAVDGQPQSQGPQAGRNAPPLHGTSPRIESARVPSRPRPEMMPPEQSEAAASVFSSMLGVASNAPYYPASPVGGQQGFQSAPGQPSGSLYAAQPMPPANPAAPSAQQGSMPGGYAGSYSNVNQNGYQNMQSPYAASPAGNAGPQLPQQTPVGAMQPGAFNAGQGFPANPASAKPGKRSFLDTIREWFHL